MHVKGAMALDGQRVDDPPAGLDALPWTQIFAVLYARGFDGTMSIEPHSSVHNNKLGETGINYTIDFTRKLMLR